MQQLFTSGIKRDKASSVKMMGSLEMTKGLSLGKAEQFGGISVLSQSEGPEKIVVRCRECSEIIETRKSYQCQ